MCLSDESAPVKPSERMEPSVCLQNYLKKNTFAELSTNALHNSIISQVSYNIKIDQMYFRKDMF